MVPIPVVVGERLVGVLTDRDIVIRVVAEGRDPLAYTVDTCMSQPVVTVRPDDALDDVVSTMERHQIRRVPVVDERGCCTGIVSQADIARAEPLSEVGELVREVSQETGRESR